MALINCPECKREVSDAAVSCPSCGYPLWERPAEPQFEAYRRRVLVGSLVICVIGVPVGLALNLPAVWALAILGIVVAGIKLAGRRRV